MSTPPSGARDSSDDMIHKTSSWLDCLYRATLSLPHIRHDCVLADDDPAALVEFIRKVVAVVPLTTRRVNVCQEAQ